MLCLVVFLMAMPLAACSQQASGDQGNGDKKGTASDKDLLQVYASVYPLYDFATKIGGEFVDVHAMMPPGVEGHDFEPTPKDMAALHDADLFLYNGAGYEAWAEKALESLDKEKTAVVEATAGVKLMTNEESGHVHAEDDHGDDHDEHGDDHKRDGDHDEDGDDHKHDSDHDEHSDDGKHSDDHDEHGDDHKHDGNHDEDDDAHAHAHGHDHDHDHGAYDPHVWLDPELAKEQARAIKDALVKLDKKNEKVYEANFDKLAKQLDELDSELQQVAQSAERKQIIVSHAAFGYLTHKYGLEQKAIAGLSPSEEPGQQKMRDIIEFAKANDVKYIMFETLVSSKVADAIKNELGAEALTLNPIENVTKEEKERGEDFLSIMKRNIDNLRTALGSKK
ncbi:metal ABC transporter solute-binding protein, Zn/Mn family [Numidum massiliense]|uniref:metal ABC transporter solute-binding protein, Zn/Mn family n=1 Tax=Numidum massiliense TaxID=1522315 RepID=UPI00093B503D|nr:zinc ABC transporter substrate-binding protein [Numidum massiliense]